MPTSASWTIVHVHVVFTLWPCDAKYRSAKMNYWYNYLPPIPPPTEVQGLAVAWCRRGRGSSMVNNIVSKQCWSGSATTNRGSARCGHAQLFFSMSAIAIPQLKKGLMQLDRRTSDLHNCNCISVIAIFLIAILKFFKKRCSATAYPQSQLFSAVRNLKKMLFRNCISALLQSIVGEWTRKICETAITPSRIQRIQIPKHG